MTITALSSAEKSSAEKTSSEMQSIRSFSDVRPFAGKVVAYKANSIFFSRNRAFVLEDVSIGFGYIEPSTSHFVSEGEGYCMMCLQKQKTVQGTFGLTDSKLKDGSLSMRLPSRDEINRIAQAILSHEANFGALGTNIIELLKQQTEAKSKAVTPAQPTPVSSAAITQPHAGTKTNRSSSSSAWTDIMSTP